jgi:hypothetical protein
VQFIGLSNKKTSWLFAATTDLFTKDNLGTAAKRRATKCDKTSRDKMSPTAERRPSRTPFFLQFFCLRADEFFVKLESNSGPDLRQFFHQFFLPASG